MRKSIILVLVLCAAVSIQAQKVLSASETGYVSEAKSQLMSALSEMDMTDNQRLSIIRRSAVTLKEYGQPPMWPEGDIPLQKIMDEQFEQCKSEIAEMSDWVLKLENKSLTQKTKLINSMQIEVLEHQVQFLIPGSTPVQLSSDAISTVFGVNITEGAGGGKSQDAKDLANRFRKLAETKALVEHFNILIDHHRESLRLIEADREMLRVKVPVWKRAFENAYNGAFALKGYEGAAEARETPVFNANSIVGTWKFGYQQTGYFYWTFTPGGEFIFEDKMNDGDTEKGRYSVSGNALRLTGPVSQCEKTEGIYIFEINDNDLEFKRIEDACMSRRFTLNHVWTRK